MNYEKTIQRIKQELEFAKRNDCYAMLDITTLELLLEYIDSLRK